MRRAAVSPQAAGVSTAKQGQSGLGLDAQRKAVRDFLNGGRWSLIAEYVEVESGANDERPKLVEALSRCRLHNSTLVIAKLDRLSRDAAFLLGLQKAGVRFLAADMPEANEMVVGIMAVVAQAERKMISARTKAALLAAKARGVKLGGDRGNLSSVADKGHKIGLAVRQEAAQQRIADIAPVVADPRAHGAASQSSFVRFVRRRASCSYDSSSTIPFSTIRITVDETYRFQSPDLRLLRYAGRLGIGHDRGPEAADQRSLPRTDPQSDPRDTCAPRVVATGPNAGQALSRAAADRLSPSSGGVGRLGRVGRLCSLWPLGEDLAGVRRFRPRTSVPVAGCEAHVCVLQTALGLIGHERRVFVVRDAIGSRRAENKETAISRMRHHGVSGSSVGVAFRCGICRPAASSALRRIALVRRDRRSGGVRPPMTSPSRELGSAGLDHCEILIALPTG